MLRRKQQLRVIASTAPCTMPPFVASAWVPTRARDLVARAITRMHTQRADWLNENGFVRFAPVQDDNYESVRLVRKMYHHSNNNVQWKYPNPTKWSSWAEGERKMENKRRGGGLSSPCDLFARCFTTATIYNENIQTKLGGGSSGEEVFVNDFFLCISIILNVRRILRGFLNTHFMFPSDPKLLHGDLCMEYCWNTKKKTIVDKTRFMRFIFLNNFRFLNNKKNGIK